MNDGCDDCTQARAGIWCGYRFGCLGCTARAIARSGDAYLAWGMKDETQRDPRPLREKVRQLLPTREARAEVLTWWRLDHPNESTTEPPRDPSCPHPTSATTTE